MNEEELETDTWLDLEAAVRAVKQGNGEAVSCWVDQLEDLYLKTWSEYENLSVLEEEVSREAVLGHLFLRQGMAFWLEALASLRDFVLLPSRELEEKVWESAESGQRLLIAIQKFELESRMQAEIRIANWN